MDGYIYICHERDMRLLNLPVFKIGRSSDIFKRTRGYKKHTIMYFSVYCHNYINS